MRSLFPFGPRYTSYRRHHIPASAVKMTVFATVMVLILAFLVLVFGQFRSGSETGYHAVFTDSSGMDDGAPVRIAGVQVGRVDGLDLSDDQTVNIGFSVDSGVILPADARAAIRYENLVGDRYLEILPTTGAGSGASPATEASGDGAVPGGTAPDGTAPDGTLPDGGTIPVDMTSPALDLDLLLGGFKPLFRALDPGQVNKLTDALVDTFQGRGQTLADLLGRTGSFTRTLADSDAVIGRVVDNLNTVLSTISDRGDQFDSVIDRLQQLVSGLASDRDPLGQAVTHISGATGSLAGLLDQARPPIDSTVEQLGRFTTLLDNDKETIDDLLSRLPETYQMLARTGSYGDFFQFYMCGLAFRFTDAQGEMFEIPMVQQTEGRCAPK